VRGYSRLSETTILISGEAVMKKKVAEVKKVSVKDFIKLAELLAKAQISITREISALLPRKSDMKGGQ